MSMWTIFSKVLKCRREYREIRAVVYKQWSQRGKFSKRLFEIVLEDRECLFEDKLEIGLNSNF